MFRRLLQRWARRRAWEHFHRFAAMEQKQLLLALAVSEETPLLRAVLCVLRGQQEMALDYARTPALPEPDLRHYAASAAALAEAQERILDLVDQANQAKLGIARRERNQS